MTALHVSLAVDTKPCHEYRGDVNNIISLDIMKMGKKVLSWTVYSWNHAPVSDMTIIISICCFRF